MAPANDATSDQGRPHPTWMKFMFFPFYLCCFAACWSTTGGDSCRVVKWVGTSMATAAATTGITYQTTVWLVPALQNCPPYGVPSLPLTPPAEQTNKTKSIIFNNKHHIDYPPATIHLTTREQLAQTPISQNLSTKNQPKRATPQHTTSTTIQLPSRTITSPRTHCNVTTQPFLNAKPSNCHPKRTPTKPTKQKTPPANGNTSSTTT